MLRRRRSDGRGRAALPVAETQLPGVGVGANGVSTPEEDRPVVRISGRDGDGRPNAVIKKRARLGFALTGLAVSPVGHRRRHPNECAEDERARVIVLFGSVNVAAERDDLDRIIARYTLRLRWSSPR